MIDVLDNYRSLVHTIADAARWACALEVTAPKLGNVHPGASFSDLRCADFLLAAEDLAAAITIHDRVGALVLHCVEQAIAAKRGNVNLGIALLIAPLAIAASKTGLGTPLTHLQSTLGAELTRLDRFDAEKVFAAIRLAQPGGLGSTTEMDANDSRQTPDSLLQAMRYASSWDSIAGCYATDFAPIFDVVVSHLVTALADTNDVLWGVREAHLHVMAELGDTLIARKCGVKVATAAQHQAQEICACSKPLQRERLITDFDHWLRADGHRRNPGTTADMIAAGLFVLLITDRSPASERKSS